MTPETVPPAEPDPITAATVACTASWSQRYIDHYADDDGRCRRCGAMAEPDTAGSPAQDRVPDTAATCCKCGEPLVVDGRTDGVICSHVPDGDRHARCCRYSGITEAPDGT